MKVVFVLTALYSAITAEATSYEGSGVDFREGLDNSVKNKRRYDPKEEDMYRTRYLLVEDQNGNYRYEDLFEEGPVARVSASDLTFYLYTQNNKDTPDVIPGVANLSSSNFQSSRKNVFIAHGWKGDYASRVNIYIRKALLSVHDVNVFVVDWSRFSKGLYLTVVSSVPGVGEAVGDFIYSIMNDYGQSSSNFYLIGHSLGAHIVGCAGARVISLSNSSVNSITGLDPAGPLFTIGNIDNRIDATDGEFVQIIHTNSRLGFSSALGHADYYPNGGKWQPGCEIDVGGTCSHIRSYMYFAESIKTSGFLSYKCKSAFSFAIGKCSNNHRSLMGELIVDKSASGDYYLKTNSRSPFAKG